ncbi:MAG TPA: periplasmic heavy metal sensor [Candidatus Methylomirabilis sp.]|jgi:Spy/CpxP family protein refolding chaperone
MTIGRCAAAALLAVAGLAAAPAAAPAGGDKVVLRFERVLAELDLSEEQRARVLGLRQQFEAEIRALTEALRRRAADLRGRIDETPGEPRTIEDLVQEIGRTQTEILRVRVRAIRDLREVLNPRQQARLRDLEESLRRVGGPAAPR